MSDKNNKTAPQRGHGQDLEAGFSPRPRQVLEEPEIITTDTVENESPAFNQTENSEQASPNPEEPKTEDSETESLLAALGGQPQNVQDSQTQPTETNPVEETSQQESKNSQILPPPAANMPQIDKPEDAKQPQTAMATPPIAPPIAPPTQQPLSNLPDNTPPQNPFEEETQEQGIAREKDESGSLSSFYQKVLQVLINAGDLGLDSTAKSQLEDALESEQPEHACRKLMAQKVLNKVQLARAFARAQQRLEILSYVDLPSEAMGLRHDLPPKVNEMLRDKRIIPIKLDKSGDISVLHLAHENAARDLVLEARLAEAMPKHTFLWHFAMREVAGSFWLAGEGDDVDAGMEAEALLDRIIGNAIDARSSDIHIDPSIRGEPRAIVKYRVDGSVLPKEVITTEQLDRLRVRIENLARMPKVNHTHPNKGSFTRAGYDWRVQIQPHSSPYGAVPRIVLRRLKPDVMPMEALGYPQYFIDKIKAAAQAPNGLVFWTGPTGSGKTESIHSAIVSVNPMAKGLSVHTIEDPPEKRVPGYALQMEAVEEDAPRSALNLLKSSLRADPDVIVFGEVRDKEMAKLVFEAANTGHLVFTTLHTNSSIDALVRLTELGINGFLLSYVRGIAAQRLVRRLCVHCRKPVEEPDEYTRYVFDKYDTDIAGAKLFTANPEGCPSCNFSGYYGRIAVAEWLKPSKEIIDASQAGQLENLEDMARRAGWQPMGHMGVYHVKNGITDAAELARKILELSGDMV